MPRSRPDRKRQSRLAFTPLPSSSPAVRDYNKQVRDRAAAVTLDVTPSPAKRRKLLSDETDRVGGSAESDRETLSAIPTPAKSLDFARSESSDDSEGGPVQVGRRKSRAHTQQRLNFDAARDPSAFSPPIRLASAKPVQSHSTTMFSSPARLCVDVSSEETEGRSEDQGTKTSRTTRQKRVSSKAKEAASRAPKPITLDSDSDDIVVSGSRKRTREPSEDESDEMPVTRGSQRRKAQRASSDGAQSESPQAVHESSDDDVIFAGSSSRKRRQQPRNIDPDDEEASEEDSEPRSSHRRRFNPSKQLSQREKEDLAEDLDFLAPSDGEDAIQQPRSSQSVKKTARAKALEKLKRSRSGNVEQISDESDQPSDGRDGEDGDFDELYDDDDDEAIRLPTNSRQMFSETQDDADFLVEEESDGPLGVPDGVPLEFTRFASMKPKELFKYAVEWFVQRKINPAYERNDEIYKLTFRKLDDEVQGLAGSKFTSSVWTPAFTLALQSRPDLVYDDLDRTASEHVFRDKCDACNRSNHPATFEIQFTGNPYYPDSLEDVEQEEDDDDDADDTTSSDSDHEDDDRPALDAQGRKIPPASKRFYVGKFCCANARTAHDLKHWRYHLNEWVETWLVKNKYCTPEKIVERDQWKTKKRRRYANKIVDEMQSRGVVKQLYTLFKHNIEDARNSKQGRFSTGDDSM